MLPCERDIRDTYHFSHPSLVGAVYPDLSLFQKIEASNESYKVSTILITAQSNLPLYSQKP